MLRWGHFDFGDIVQLADKRVEYSPPFVDMGQFPPPENDRNGDLVFVLQKLPGVIDLEIDVVLSRLGTNANFLGPTVVSLRLALVLPLFLVVFEFPVVHDPTDRRTLTRRNLDQIQPCVTRHLKRLFSWQDP